VSPHTLFIILSSVEVALGAVTLALLIRSKEFRTYWPMLAVSMWQTVPFFTLIYLQHLGKSRISAQKAYFYYFQTFWIAYAVQAVCQIFLTYTIFDGAMRPLKGLHRLGKVVYFWAAAISIVIAGNVVISPSLGRSLLMQSIVGQFQRASAIITVSLVIFVCAAIRPMGLSFRSRVFGSGLGLIIVALTNTLQANFFYQPRTMYGTYARITIAMNCICQMIWIYYFAVPEPKRKFVLLPTTSPFHHWNRISELLGHEPGFVAIGGVPPESFAMAEIDIFKRASANMKALEDKEQAAALPVGRG
jgi:hypothetical protein